MNEEKRHPLYRLYEIIPGAMVWVTFLLIIFLSWWKPLWAIYFIVVFSVYWLLRILYTGVYVAISFVKFRSELKIDWQQKLEALPQWHDQVHHLIILPRVTEGWQVLKTTFEGLKNSRYNAKKFIVVVTSEVVDEEGFREMEAKLHEQYGESFFKLITTVHPDPLTRGELQGKGSNATWGAREATKFIDEAGLDIENIIVSNFDVDTAAHEQYFSYLTYKFLTHPQPHNTSFQPVPLFHNNVWDAPAFARVVSNSTTFWLLSEHLRPERQFTFSSHSMSYKLLLEVGYWNTQIVTEDSRVSIDCFLQKKGEYMVTPMYVPVSMDTVMGGSVWGTAKSQYKQMRRWAYGAENGPYMLWHFTRVKGLPLRKWRYAFNQIEGVYSWSTAPIVLFLASQLPFLFLTEADRTNIFVQSAPAILTYIMLVALLNLGMMMVLATLILPQRMSRKARVYEWLFMVLQWLLLPFTLVIFGSIPATDAETRLMLGKYFSKFELTEKTRSKPAQVN